MLAACEGFRIRVHRLCEVRPVVNSALHVVVIRACLVETGMEMKCTKVEWPPIYARLQDLPRVIVESMILVLHPDEQVDELLLKNEFKAQQELI